MSENNVAEQLLEGQGATEQEIDGSLSDFSASIASNLVEQSNGVTQLPFESATHTYQDDVTVGALPGNDLETTNQLDRDDAKSTEDTARDDMFVDCPDELSTFDGRQTDIKEETEAGESRENLEENRRSHFGELSNGVGDGSVENTVAEKESITPEYKEEREIFAHGVLDLHCKLKALSCQQSLPYEAEVGGRDKEAQLADIPLREMIKECLEFVKTTSEERSNAEATIRNLHALLSEKDHQIENLNTKVTELVVSHDNSPQNTLEVSSESDIATDRIMSSLATVVSLEQVLDSSISGKIVLIEEGTALLIEKYNNILSEIYQLGRTVSEAGFDTMEQEYGNVLVAAHGGLLELKRKETELIERLAHLEDENRKLVEQLDKERVMIGTLSTEIGNMKVELEQEKIKCANTREKLSMAVTKGKALVQQRDSLKQYLAEKSSEHEKCLIELQEKSAELEGARLTKDELVQKENLVASLQNSLLQSNMIIEQVEKILSQTEPDKPEFLDMLERLRWIVDDRNVLKGSFLEFCKLNDALSLINLPESVSSSDLESKINWLWNSYYRARDDTNILQEEISTIKEAAYNYIDCLSASFLLESQEKYYLQSELTDLRCKYEEIIEMNHQISMEKDQMVKMLVELSGYNLEDKAIDCSSSDTFMIVNLCFQMIKEQSGPFSRSSHIDADLIERIQSHLYASNQGLALCEDILEEEMLIRSEVNKLSNELKMAADEILVMKEEKSSLQKDLDQSGEKSAILRDKLSMAVKKGKGLVQDRDNLKSLINEKNLEIEQLKLDMQKQESVVSEYSDRINKLSSDVDSIPKLEAELQAVKGERNQFEKFLFESNNLLQRVIESIDHVVLPIDSIFEEPVEKVKWLAGFVSECQDAKLHAEQELQLVKEGASNLESKLAEAQATVKSLEQALSSSDNNISQAAEEKRELELGKTKVEEELHEVKEELAEVCESAMLLKAALSQAGKDIAVISNEKQLAQAGRTAAATELERVKEAASLTSKLAEASTTIKYLEEIGESTMLLRAALSQAQKDIAVLSSEKELAQTDRAAVETELERVKEEAAMLASKLAEASATIKELEEVGESSMSLRAALSQAEKDIAVLSSEKELAQTGRAAVKTELERVKEEAARLTSKLAEASVTIKELEEVGESTVSLRAALSQAEKDIAVLSNEKDLAQTSRAAAETELERVKEEAARLTSKLAEASTTIKELEEVGESTMSLRAALSQAEKDIAVLSNEKDLAQTGRAAANTELERVKEEAARLTSKLAEASTTIKELEEVGESTMSLRAALSQVEKDIAVLSNEKDLAQTGRAAAEIELERVKEEAARLTSKLAEASTTIKDLEDTLFQAESNVNLLEEKCDADQVVKTNMENELKKLQDEAECQASKLADASATIKSLEDALLKAQNDISVLEDANKIAKEEMSSLSFKLNSCLDELAGKNGSLENRSIELIGLLNDLQVLMKENTLLPRVKQCFARKFETLKNIDLILNKIRDYTVGMTAKDPGRHHMMEEDPFVRNSSFDGIEDFDVEVDSRVINDTDIDDMISIFGKIVKGFQLRNKLIADRFDDFSDSIDEFISLLQTKLLETETDIISILETMETLKEKVNSSESLKEEQENTIATLENDITVLLSACTDASCELQTEVHRNLVEPGPISVIMNLDADALAKHHQNSKYMETAQKLMTTTRKAQNLIKQFEFRSKEVGTTIEDLQNQLKETKTASEKGIEERDLSQKRVLQLESDIQVLQNSCCELRNNLEGYHALEERLKEKEAEISSLYSALSTKQEEAENSLLSASQVRTLFGKIDRIEIPFVESREEDMEPNTSAPVKKLFYIIDRVTQLHHQMISLSHDKEELQTTLAAKVLEIKHLEEEVKQLNSNWEDLDKVKNELSVYTFDLERILGMLGTSNWVEDKKSTGLKELIPVLEKQVMAILLESENAKSKAQELGGKLLGSQKLIDELTTKVRLFEGSLNDNTSQPEVVQERSLFEAPSLPVGSEISEVEEGSLGKKVISPVPSAALVRNMRKGSTDHLALDIDEESHHLISSADIDEDKGHVFKSLNTSGFVPKQGKFIADRIDGIWVSGGRLLMSRPRARLGLIGYLLLLHIWLLGTIL